MHHTQAAILRNLDPSDPGTVQALIDFHRVAFGGWRMEGEDGQSVQGEPNGGDPKPGEGDQQGGESGDKPLGPGGESALKAEREARKAIETELSQFKAGLAAALGLKDKDAKSGTDDIVATLQQQMADLQHHNLVLSVANENEITDTDDLALLRGFKGDEDAIRRLAARLKPTKEDAAGSNGKRRTPSPDPSQGRGDSKGATGREAGLAEARKRFPQPAKQ